MPKSDAACFKEALKLWDRPDQELRSRGVLEADIDVDHVVDALFDRLLALDIDRRYPFVGTC
ncbi:MAG TPA: hypothetical protein PK668_24900 [Myxococcota bacterium]|nr:hypothetical protein [Myxococcota bacterium]HRY96820.1 hypothetical protein [Myxococcota bacterium]HSA22684.1 hypothetical protein [Myxococcota bacterium]